jgi:hypothetical protein
MEETTKQISSAGRIGMRGGKQIKGGRWADEKINHWQRFAK